MREGLAYARERTLTDEGVRSGKTAEGKPPHKGALVGDTRCGAGAAWARGGRRVPNSAARTVGQKYARIRKWKIGRASLIRVRAVVTGPLIEGWRLGQDRCRK